MSKPCASPIAQGSCLLGCGCFLYPAVELRLVFGDPGFGSLLDVAIVLGLADRSFPSDPGRQGEVELLDQPANRRVLRQERAIDDRLIVPRPDRHATRILAASATDHALDQRAL